tara:strand:- start:141 stop:1007 length:867 start_codon:yes stop_codon:yes gene_type:complete
MFPIFLLISSCFLFSILAALIKFNSQFIHPIEQAFFRNFISIFLLLPFIFRAREIIKNKENIKLLVLRGFFGGITMILLFCSYTMIPLSQAMAVSFSTPLFIYLGGIIFFKEKTSRLSNFLIILGFILTLVILRPDLELKIGVIIALIAAITHAAAGLLVKKISQTESVVTLMFSMVVLMTPITFIPSIHFWTAPIDYKSYLLLISIAVVATIGNFCWTKALSISKLTNLMSFDFTKLIFTTILGLLFFDEKIEFITIICGTGLLICSNLTLLDLKKNDKNKSLLSNN